jgi:hypothetical protein
MISVRIVITDQILCWRKRFSHTEFQNSVKNYTPVASQHPCSLCMTVKLELSRIPSSCLHVNYTSSTKMSAACLQLRDWCSLVAATCYRQTQECCVFVSMLKRWVILEVIETDEVYNWSQASVGSAVTRVTGWNTKESLFDSRERLR